MMFSRKASRSHEPERVPYDPETQEAVIRCSICTGEKVAGFRDLKTGHFTEVMLIRSPEDEKRFLSFYHLDSAKIIY